MIHSIYPQKDSTIYEISQSVNTGVDQILELRHDAPKSGSVWNSRILMRFDLSEFSSSIVDGTISNPKYYLKLTSVDARALPAESTIMIHAVSGSWDMGLGKLHHRPYTKEGVSWKFSDGQSGGTIWNTGSLSGNTTSSYKTVAGGGVWYTGSGYEASQSLTFESIDIRADITDIVNNWLSGDIVNDGVIIKRQNSDENSDGVKGNLSYFSVESNTIFVPRLEIAWDDSSISTGSLSELTDDQIVIRPKLRRQYSQTSKPKIRIQSREYYPTRTFATSSEYLTTKFLPTSSYYQIEDLHTEQVIVPFDTGSTKLSVDADGNYMRLWMDSFMPKRYYKIIFKVVKDNGDTELIYDNNYIFKVV